MSVVAFAARPHPTANQPKKDLYEIGQIPPLGHVPKNMYAWVIRRERHGPPEQSMQLEVVGNVAYYDNIVGRRHLDQAAHEPGAADASRQHHDSSHRCRDTTSP